MQDLFQGNGSIELSGFNNLCTYVPEVCQHHGQVLPCFRLSTT